MAKPQIDTSDLPDAIRWETLRLHYFQQHGFDVSEIQRLLDHYITRACKEPAPSQADSDES